MGQAAILDIQSLNETRRPSAGDVQTLRADQHDVIFYEGDTARRYYKLIDGAMMLYRLLPDGRRQIIELLGPGDYFGLTSAIEHDCTAEVLRPSMISTFDRKACANSDDFQADVSAYLIEHLQDLHAHTVLLGRKSACERITSSLAGLTGDADDDSARIRLNMTRQEIADYLGLTIETVSRTFSDLRRRGVISMERQDVILIADVSALTALTGDE